MSGATAPLRRWALLLLLLASCSGAGGELAAVSEPSAPPPLAQDAEQPAIQRPAEQSSEQQSEQQAQLVRDITDARIAAYDARAAAFGLRRVDAARRAASETHAGRALLHLLYASLMDNGFAYELNDLAVDIQSVALVDDATAIVETCAKYDLRQRRRSDGEVIDPFDQNGPATRQSTDEMVYTDGAWKLSSSVVNLEELDDVACPLTGRQGRPISQQQVRHRRTRAEAAYVQAVRAHDSGRLDEFFTGDLHTRLAFDPMSPRGTLSMDDHCPRYPPIVDRGEVADPRPWVLTEDVPDAFDRYWREIYRKPPPDSEDLIAGRDADGRPNRFTSPRYVTRCMNEYLFASSYVYPVYTREAHSTVEVLDVFYPTEGPPKAVYLDVCRVLELPREGNAVISAAVVRSRESLRLDGGDWKLAARWDVSLTEDTSRGCA